jgi:hypothetical protein
MNLLQAKNIVKQHLAKTKKKKNPFKTSTSLWTTLLKAKFEVVKLVLHEYLESAKYYLDVFLVN